MKILQVISSFPPAYAYGGPPRSAYNLSAALVDGGHEVTVFTTDANDAESRVAIGSNPEVVDGIKVYRFRNVSNTLSWKNIPLAPRMGSEILRELDEFDVVHTHEYRSFHTLFAHWCSEHQEVPHVLQPRGSLPRHSKSKVKTAFDKLVGTDIVKSADGVLASSRIESNQFTDVVPELELGSIYHVPNAIISEDYEGIPEDGTFRQQFGIDEDDELVLFLSRLHPRKGGDLLIEAVSKLRADGWDISLAFVGPDEGDRQRLEMLARDKNIPEVTHFTGPLYDEDKLAAYVDSDVFILPSKNEYESFGNVVIEAMACGTPAVVTNVSGVTEWIEHQSCRVVTPTVSDLKGGIESLLNSPVPESATRKYIFENFTWDTVAERTESIYNELIP